MVEDDLSRVEKSVTKSTYKLGIGFERCEDKGEKSAPKFIPSSTYHQEEKTIKSTKAHYPSNPKPSFNPKREVRKETPKLRECHTPFRERRNEASIRVPRMFKSHAWQQYDKQMQCY
jgi:hypothetical protein